MKRILMAGCIIASLMACNDNGSGNSANNKDSSYNSTDTGQGIGPGSTTDTTRNMPRTSEDTTRR